MSTSITNNSLPTNHQKNKDCHQQQSQGVRRKPYNRIEVRLTPEKKNTMYMNDDRTL